MDVVLYLFRDSQLLWWDLDAFPSCSVPGHPRVKYNKATDMFCYAGTLDNLVKDYWERRRKGAYWAGAPGPGSVKLRYPWPNLSRTVFTAAGSPNSFVMFYEWPWISSALSKKSHTCGRKMKSNFPAGRFAWTNVLTKTMATKLIISCETKQFRRRDFQGKTKGCSLGEGSWDFFLSYVCVDLIVMSFLDVTYWSR